MIGAVVRPGGEKVARRGSGPVGRYVPAVYEKLLDSSKVYSTTQYIKYQNFNKLRH